MSIRIKCPACKAINTVDDAQRGQKVRCQECKKLLAAPKPAAAKTEEDAIQERPKVKISSSAKRREDESAPSESRSVKKSTTPARSGLAFALIALAALVLVTCLLAGAGGGAWLVWRQPEMPDKNDAVANAGINKDMPKGAQAKDAEEKKQPDQPAKKNPMDPAGIDFNLAQVRKSVVFVKRLTPGLGTATGSGFRSEERRVGKECR